MVDVDSLEARLRRDMVSAPLGKQLTFATRQPQRRLAEIVNEELRARDEPDGRLRGCVSSSDCRLSIVGLGVEVDDGSPLRSETNREGHGAALFTGER